MISSLHSFPCFHSLVAIAEHIKVSKVSCQGFFCLDGQQTGQITPTDGMLMQNGWCGMIGKGWKNHPVCVRMQRGNMTGNKDRSVRKVRHE